MWNGYKKPTCSYFYATGRHWAGRRTFEFVVFSGERVELALEIFVGLLELREFLLQTTDVGVGRLQVAVEFVDSPLEVAVARLRLLQSLRVLRQRRVRLQPTFNGKFTPSDDTTQLDGLLELSRVGRCELSRRQSPTVCDRVSKLFERQSWVVENSIHTARRRRDSTRPLSWVGVNGLFIYTVMCSVAILRSIHIIHITFLTSFYLNWTKLNWGSAVHFSSEMRSDEIYERSCIQVVKSNGSDSRRAWIVQSYSPGGAYIYPGMWFIGPRRVCITTVYRDGFSCFGTAHGSTQHSQTHTHHVACDIVGKKPQLLVSAHLWLLPKISSFLHIDSK